VPGEEAVDAFIGFIRESLNCITDDRLLAHQESEKLYKLFFKSPAKVTARNGARFYVSVTQTFTVIKREDGTFKVHSREYSYVFSSNNEPTNKGVLAYHWHPHDFELRDPHLHVTITQNMGYPEIERRISRAHFPTSRVCLEDFILLLINYYDIKPMLPPSKYWRVLRKNKAAFGKQASWFVGTPH
jgi:hypothetical protein